MSCKKVVLNSFDVVSPVIPYGASFEDTLFNPDKSWNNSQQLDMKVLLKPLRKEVRRMNRTSSLAYLSSSNVMNKSGVLNINFNPYRFGTIFSTHNASYESVLKILKELYKNGTEGVSPIDFSYSVGNSLIAGVTKKYQLKGPSTAVPSSDPILLARMILNQDEADYILAGSYNICLDENISYYKSIDYLNGDPTEFTKLLEEAEGMVAREMGISMILEGYKDDKSDTNKCCLTGLSNIHSINNKKQQYKSNIYDISSDCELSNFSSEDFTRSMSLALKDAGITADDVDAVFTCSCGNPGLDLPEFEAAKNMFGEKTEFVAIQGVFGGNFGGNFMINSAAAAASLEKQCLPPSKGVPDSNNFFNKECKNIELTTILVNGYTDLGNIISGVWQWI